MSVTLCYLLTVFGVFRLRQADFNVLEQKRSMQTMADAKAVELRQKDASLEQMKADVSI